MAGSAIASTNASHVIRWDWAARVLMSWNASQYITHASRVSWAFNAFTQSIFMWCPLVRTVVGTTVGLMTIVLGDRPWVDVFDDYEGTRRGYPGRHRAASLTPLPWRVTAAQAVTAVGLGAFAALAVAPTALVADLRLDSSPDAVLAGPGLYVPETPTQVAPGPKLKPSGPVLPGPPTRRRAGHPKMSGPPTGTATSKRAEQAPSSPSRRTSLTPSQRAPHGS